MRVQVSLSVTLSVYNERKYFQNGIIITKPNNCHSELVSESVRNTEKDCHGLAPSQ
ncbi:MAG: hypothetical protein K6C94_03635 [Candidatus Gastranaerophilales bacterium]|nr:hypothetical protein [Candidatus Gastranaerophilales bacterium]